MTTAVGTEQRTLRKDHQMNRQQSLLVVDSCVCCECVCVCVCVFAWSHTSFHGVWVLVVMYKKPSVPFVTFGLDGTPQRITQPSLSTCASLSFSFLPVSCCLGRMTGAICQFVCVARPTFFVVCVCMYFCLFVRMVVRLYGCMAVWWSSREFVSNLKLHPSR